MRRRLNHDNGAQTRWPLDSGAQILARNIAFRTFETHDLCCPYGPPCVLTGGGAFGQALLEMPSAALRTSIP